MKESKSLRTKNKVLEAAVELAIEDGYQHIQRDTVAQRAGCATGTVNLYFGTMTQLKRAVMRYAIANEVDKIIMQGFASGDPQVSKLSDKEKQRVCSLLINS